MTGSVTLTGLYFGRQSILKLAVHVSSGSMVLTTFRSVPHFRLYGSVFLVYAQWLFFQKLVNKIEILQCECFKMHLGNIFKHYQLVILLFLSGDSYD